MRRPQKLRNSMYSCDVFPAYGAYASVSVGGVVPCQALTMQPCHAPVIEGYVESRKARLLLMQWVPGTVYASHHFKWDDPFH